MEKNVEGNFREELRKSRGRDIGFKIRTAASEKSLKEFVVDERRKIVTNKKVDKN